MSSQGTFDASRTEIDQVDGTLRTVQCSPPSSVFTKGAEEHPNDEQGAFVHLKKPSSAPFSTCEHSHRSELTKRTHEQSEGDGGDLVSKEGKFSDHSACAKHSMEVSSAVVVDDENTRGGIRPRYASAVPAPASLQQPFPPQSMCLPGQEIDGPGTVQGSEDKVWKCTACGGVNYIHHKTCAICEAERSNDLANRGNAQEIGGVAVAAEQDHLVWHCLQCKVANSIRDPTCALCKGAPGGSQAGSVAKPSVLEALFNNLSSAADNIELIEVAIERIATRMKAAERQPPLITPAQCDIFLHTLRVYGCKNIAIAGHCCLTFIVLCLSPENVLNLAALNGFPLLYPIMKKYWKNVDIAALSSGVFYTLRNCSMPVIVANSIGALDLIGGLIFRQHLRNSHVLLQCCNSLVLLSYQDVDMLAFVEVGGLELLFSALQIHINNNERDLLLTYLFKVLKNFAHHIPNKHIMVQLGGIDIIFSILRIHKNDGGLVATGLELLVILGQGTPDITFAVVEKGLFDLLFSLLDQHADDPEVIAAGCTALCTMADCETNQNIIVRKGGVQVIIQAMQKHHNQADAVAMGCAALHNLLFEDHNMTSVVRGGGIQAVLAAVTTHSANAKVALYGCRALRVFAINFSTELMQASASSAIFTAMRIHMNDADIVGICFAALTHMCHLLSNNGLSYVSVVLSTLREHLHYAPAAKVGCSLLCALSRNGAVIQNTITNGDGIALILSILQIHEGIEEVAVQGCNALGALVTANDNSKVVLGEAGGIEVLADMLARYTVVWSGSTVNAACRALTKALRCSPTNVAQLRNNANAAELLIMVKSVHGANDEIMETVNILIELLTN